MNLKLNLITAIASLFVFSNADAQCFGPGCRNLTSTVPTSYVTYASNNVSSGVKHYKNVPNPVYSKVYKNLRLISGRLISVPVINGEYPIIEERILNGSVHYILDYADRGKVESSPSSSKTYERKTEVPQRRPDDKSSKTYERKTEVPQRRPSSKIQVDSPSEKADNSPSNDESSRKEKSWFSK